MRDRSGAVCAPAPQRKLVPGEPEASGEHAAEPTRTRVNIEDPVALLAVEMVMVLGGDRRQLVAVGLSGDNDRRDRAVVEQSIHNAVHRAKAEARRILCREFVDLLHGKRSPNGLDRRPDRTLLGCVASSYRSGPP